MDRSAGDNNINNEDQGNNNTTQSHWTQQHHLPHRTNPRRVQQSQTQQQTHQQQPPPPPPHQQPPCPRCSSTDTKFGYYNNYNLTQPRYFCKGCKRYWTHGGALRNVPVGGGSRKTAKRPKLSPAANTTQPSPLQQVSPPPPHELSRFGVSVSNPLVINPAKVLEIGEGSALSLPITTALSVSPPLPTSSPSSLPASPLMINYLNPNYPHLPQGEDRHHGFFTSLIGFQGMNAAGATSQPFFTPVSRGSGGFESAATPSMNNLGPLFHFSPLLTQEPPGWHRQSFVTAGAGEVHHQVFNQLPGVPVTSVDGPMFCRTSADRRHDDGAVEVKDDDANRGGRSSEKVTDQQPDTSNYGRDGNQ